LVPPCVANAQEKDDFEAEVQKLLSMRRAKALRWCCDPASPFAVGADLIVMVCLEPLVFHGFAVAKVLGPGQKKRKQPAECQEHKQKQHPPAMALELGCLASHFSFGGSLMCRRCHYKSGFLVALCF
jgi:hypothetical protein